jgi:hypothetical protein
LSWVWRRAAAPDMLVVEGDHVALALSPVAGLMFIYIVGLRY